MEITIKVQGVAGVQAKLNAIQQTLADPTEITKNVATIIQGQAIENAGGGQGSHAGGFPNRQTGALAGSISMTLTSPNSAIVGSRLVPHYAPDVEYGHTQNIDKVSKAGKPYGRFVPAIGRRLINPNVPAYPFMQPAIKMSMDKIKRWLEFYFKKLT